MAGGAKGPGKMSINLSYCVDVVYNYDKNSYFINIFQVCSSFCHVLIPIKRLIYGLFHLTSPHKR